VDDTGVLTRPEERILINTRSIHLRLLRRKVTLDKAWSWKNYSRPTLIKPKKSSFDKICGTCRVWRLSPISWGNVKQVWISTTLN
jgi:hypothetical protein